MSEQYGSSARPSTVTLFPPRERLLRIGVDSLTNEDLISILIRVCLSRPLAMVAAKQIAHHYSPSLHELAQMTLDDLRGITPQVTPSGYSQMIAGIELGRRVALADRPFEANGGITTTGQAIDFCRNTFRRLAVDAVQEEFHMVTLDTKHKPTSTHQVTVGTLDAALVHPREVFRPAIRQSAAAVLLVHNHPSGDPTPSREDHLVTEQLTEAGNLLGIQVLDHIVVARDGCVSVREQATR